MEAVLNKCTLSSLCTTGTTGKRSQRVIAVVGHVISDHVSNRAVKRSEGLLLLALSVTAYSVHKMLVSRKRDDSVAQ